MCLCYHVGSRKSVTLNICMYMLCYLFWLIFPFVHALGYLTMTEWRDTHAIQSVIQKGTSLYTRCSCYNSDLDCCISLVDSLGWV